MTDTPTPPVPGPTPAPQAEPAPPVGYTPPATQADLDRILGARLNQERAKFGGLTGDQVAELRDKAKRGDELDAQNATDVEKREKAARDAATTEADNRYRPMLAETALRVAIGDRRPDAEVDEFIAETNLSRFLTEDGKVDTAKVLARAATFAPVTTDAAPKTPAPRGPLVPGHNPGGPAPIKPGDAGRAAAESRGLIKPAS